ncbi:hypothetical protein ACLMJK_007980 [Lecanora helva]
MYDEASDSHRSNAPSRYDDNPQYGRSKFPTRSEYKNHYPQETRSLVSYADDNSAITKPVGRRPYVSMRESCSLDYYEFEKGEFKPGTIIRAPIHEEDFRRTPRPLRSRSGSDMSCRSGQSSHISHTDYGPVYSENRLFIVVEQFHSHYLAVPLFTYSGRGLRNEHDITEYASIEDHRYPGSSKRTAPQLLTTGEMKGTVKPLKPESVAHLTYPVSRKYNLHVAYQGRLRTEDTDLLIKLFRSGGRL